MTIIHRKRRVLSALVVALALLGVGVTGSSPASALAIPYAQSGHSDCTDGTSFGGQIWSNGRFFATNPVYFYPARSVNETVYYQLELQIYTPNGWFTLTPWPTALTTWTPLFGVYVNNRWYKSINVPSTKWYQMQASYNWQGPSDKITWSIAPQITDYQLVNNGYYRVNYNLYWPSTGQQTSIQSNWCQVSGLP